MIIKPKVGMFKGMFHGMGFGRSASPSGGGPDLYYYTTGSDSCNTGFQNPEAGWAWGAPITVGAAGNITKVGIKVETKGAADVKMMLLYYSDPNWLIHECVILVNANINATSWNDVTLATPYAAGTNQVVRIMCGQTVSYSISYYTNGDLTGGFVDTTHAYATFCDSVPNTFNDWKMMGLRIYVD